MRAAFRSFLRWRGDVLCTPPGQAVADFNRDGKLDLAVLTFYFGAFSVWYGNGDGTFTPGTHSVSVPGTLRTFIMAVTAFTHGGYPEVGHGTVPWDLRTKN